MLRLCRKKNDKSENENRVFHVLLFRFLKLGRSICICPLVFDQLAKERLVIICDEKNKAVNLGMKVLSQFVDYIFQRLTVKQAAVVFELLMKRTQIETAKKLKKTQATINKHTQAAGWQELEKLLKDYENLVQLIET